MQKIAKMMHFYFPMNKKYNHNHFWGPDIKCNFENYIPEQLMKTDLSDSMITNENQLYMEQRIKQRKFI